MLLRIGLEMLLAALAVMGLYTVIRVLMAVLGGDGRVFTVVEIRNAAELREAESLICEVLTDPLICRKSRVALMIPPTLCHSEELKRITERYGLFCLVTGEEKIQG